MDKTCKDCIHYELIKTEASSFCLCSMAFEMSERRKHNPNVECEYFADRSEWVHLPCKVGDTVYYFLDGSNYKKYETVNVVGFHTDKYRTAFEIEVCGVKMRVDIGFLGEKIFLTREEADVCKRLHKFLRLLQQ